MKFYTCCWRRVSRWIGCGLLPRDSERVNFSDAFMVIEHFKNQDVEAVRKRFREKGRMLPENVDYRASWIEGNGARCFQIMEAPDAVALRVWSERWEDLVDFEVVPVVTSEEFWSRVPR